MQDIISMAPELKVIQEKDTTGYVEMDIMAHGDWAWLEEEEYGRNSPMRFVVRHIGHDMRAYDEYGYLYDEQGNKEKEGAPL